MGAWASLKTILFGATEAPPAKEVTHVGGYNPHSGAGTYSRYGDGSKWENGLSHSGSSIYQDHYTLRQNARKAYHDTPQARAIVDRYADVVVDTGIKIQPTPDAALLGITPEVAEDWAERIGRRYDLWLASKDCHRAEAMTGYQAQRLYQIFQQRDNDIFTRLHYNGSARLQSKLQFSFLDPTQIRGDAFTSTAGFNGNDSDGIKRDAAGREIGYKVWLKKPGALGQYIEKDIPAWGPKSQRRMMLHGFSPEYASQGRGISRLSHALQEFQNLTDFSLATIKKAINQSNITMYVKPSQNNEASNPFEGMTGTAGPASQQFGSDPTPAQNAQNVDVQPVEYCPLPEAAVGVPGSTGVFNLKEGEDLNAFPNSATADTFDSFVDSFTSHLSASMSMPLEVLLMKFGSNYSASRGALILFWRVAWIWRQEMDADFLAPLYASWLAEEIAAGREIAPGWSDPRMRAAWLSHDLVASPIPNIDDLKTAKANKTNLEINATTFDRVARETNGSNGKANRSKLTRELKEWQKMPWEKVKNG